MNLFFSSPIGLGHASRDAAVAGYSGGGIRFVTGGAAAEFLKMTGYDVINQYTPPQFTIQDGALVKSNGWLWKYYKYYRDCKKISSHIIRNERPDIITSDEDFASLAVAQGKNIPCVLITDILETRFVRGLASLIEKKMNRSMRDIISSCDAVIIPEDGPDEGNIRRVGPIVRQVRFPRNELRRRLGFEKKTVVITVGGTGAGAFLVKSALSAVRKTGHDAVVVAGPSLQAEPGVRNLGFVDNLHEVICAADLVIAPAGRSTMDEAAAYGTPGIFIPIRNHFEQEDNAKRHGFNHDDILKLESLIEERIGRRPTESNAGGAQKAWEIIQDIVRGTHSG